MTGISVAIGGEIGWALQGSRSHSRVTATTPTTHRQSNSNPPMRMMGKSGERFLAVVSGAGGGNGGEGGA